MTEDYKKRLTGRKPKLLTRTHCVMVRFDDEEYARFMSRYKESGVYAKAVFCKSMVFGESFRVIQANKEKEDDCRKLYSLHAWFREMATSYNLAVKELHSHFSERKTMALLNRMEGMTKEMSAIVRQVIALVKDISIQWEQAVVSG
ncbi:MAG: hypothetical protein IJ551_07985 [Prevotella sp.]|nr:hypothetical protein [Prevotella sp.]